jgi:thiamine-phosphate pyrophosphorylase
MTEEHELGPSVEDRLQALGEGLRMVARAARPRVAESLKLARQALRGVDSAVAGSLRLLEHAPSVAGLYVVVDPSHCGGRDPITVAEQALRGGASVIQWRDKKRDKGLQLPTVRALRDLCNRYVALLIINDHVDLAIAADADGVHIGQHDLPIAAVRRISPAGFIVGCSTNNPEEARLAQEAGADYVAVGRVFPSTTKADTREASPDTVRAVRAVASVPVVAIGGITAANVDEVIAAGADAAAVITAVCEAADVEEAALVISKRFEGADQRLR